MAVDPVVMRIQAQQQLQAAMAAAEAAPQEQPAEASPETVQRIEIVLPDIHVQPPQINVEPTPIIVDNHAAPIDVHVPQAAVNVYPPAPAAAVAEQPAAKRGKRRVVIERDARGNLTGAEIQDPQDG